MGLRSSPLRGKARCAFQVDALEEAVALRRRGRLFGDPRRAQRWELKHNLSFKSDID